MNAYIFEAGSERGFGVLPGKVAFMNPTSRWLLVDSGGSTTAFSRSPYWAWLRHVFFAMAYALTVVTSLSVVYSGTQVAIAWPSIGIAVWWAVTCRSWRVFAMVCAFVFVVPPSYLGFSEGISFSGAILIGLSHVVAGPAVGPIMALFEKFHRTELEDMKGHLFAPFARIQVPRHVYRLLLASLILIPISKSFTILAIANGGESVSLTLYTGLILRDLAGVIVLAGPGIAISSSVVRSIRAPAIREFIAVVAVTTILLTLIFTYGQQLPVVYLALLPLYWSATRLPVALAVIHAVFTALLTGFFSFWISMGPFSVSDHVSFAQATAIQLFAIMCVLLSLVVSTTVQQHSALVVELEALVATIPDALLIINRFGNAFPVNDLAKELVVKGTDGEFHMRSLKEIDGALLKESNRPGSRALRGETVEGVLVELADVPADGTDDDRRFYSVSASPFYLHGETEAGHALMLYHDSTDEYWTMRKLQRAHDDARSLFEHAPQGVATLDDAGVIIQANRALGELVGVPAYQLSGRYLDEFSQEEDLTEEISAALAEPGILVHSDRCFTAVDGVSRRLALTFRTTTGENAIPGLLLVNAVDITERQRLHELVSHLADHDPLTGLVNRRRFESDFERIVQRSEHELNDGALLLIDLDNFKQINDVLGHQAGDEVLIEIAGLLRECVRPTDIVGRLGGDEFVIALADITQEDVTTIGNRIVETVHQQLKDRPDVVRRVTASVGIVMFSEARDRGMDPFILADQLLYDAKDSGRNRFAVLTPINDGAQPPGSRVTRNHIEHILDKEALTLELQPILNMTTGEIALAEGLARISPAETSVTTGEFIAAVERAGLGPQLDMYVIRKGIQLLSELQGARPGFRLALNISAQSCGADEVCSLLVSELEKHNVTPGSLILELTESAPLEDVEAARRFQHTLEEHGVIFALDDFGAGFDPYRYLKQLDFHILKISGEFVEGMAEEGVDRSIVYSIARLAQEQGMDTVAEFVSSEKIFQAVKQSGITYAQGYHIGRSLALTDFITTHLTPNTQDREDKE